MSESYSVEAVLSARDAGFTAGMESASRSAKNLEKTSASIGKTIRDSFAFGVVMRSGQKAFDLAARGAAGLVQELSASSATWKTFEGNMKNFGKSSQTITKVRGDLQKFATETIYSASDMASTYSQLAAVGTKDTTNLVKAFGGLAAAAENPQQAMKTLSQQATQMAAKPTVQWMDFKLMLEQTPAGIAAVAGAMGKSTSQLIKDVQDGKVKTEDFFNAMKKAAGEGTKFNKMATEYKTVGQAMDGLTETLTTKLQPAYDKLSAYGIKAVERLSGVLDKINGDKLAKNLGTALDQAVPVMENLFKTITPYAISAGKTLVEFGKAAFDVGRAIVTDQSVMAAFQNAFSAIGGAIQTASGFISEHKEIIAKLTPAILGAIVGFKAFKGVKGILDGIFGSSSPLGGGGGIASTIESIGSLIQSFGQGLESTFTGLGSLIQGVGSGISAAASGIGTGISAAIQGIAMAFNMLQPMGLLMFAGAVAVVVGAIVALSAAKGLIIPFLEGLVGVFQKVAAIIPPLVQGIVQGLVQGLAQGLAAFAPTAQALASAISTLSPVIIAFGIAISTVVQGIGAALAQVLPALVPVITALGSAITAIVGQLGTSISQIVSTLGSALSMLVSALGGAISTIIQGIGKAQSYVAAALTPIVSIIASAVTQIITVIAPYIPNIQKMVEATTSVVNNIIRLFGLLVSNLSGIINSLATLVTALGTQICNIFLAISVTLQTAGNVIAQVLLALATTVQTVFSSISNLFTAFGNTVSTVFNSISTVISTVGTSIRTVLDGISGVFTSIGTAAKNAGTGMLNLAKGIKQLVGLNLADLTTTLIATSKGLASMAKSGTGLASVSKALAGIGQAGNAAKAGLLAVGASAKASAQMLVGLGKAVIASASAMKAGGTQAGNGFAKPIQSGMKNAATATKNAMKTVTSSIKSAAAKATAGGKQMGTGISNGLRSGLASIGSICSSAINSIPPRIRAGYGAAYSAGHHVGAGVAAGLRSALGSVTAAANAIVSQVNRAMQAKAKIHSPSKLTNKKVGQPMAEGIAKGLIKKTGEVSRTAGTFIGTVTAELRDKVKRSQNTAMMRELLFGYSSGSANSIAKDGKTYVSTAIAQLKSLSKKTEGAYSSSWDSVAKGMEASFEASQSKTLKAASANAKKTIDRYYGTDILSKTITKNNNKIKKNKSQISALQIANREASKEQRKINNKKITALKKSNQKLSKKNEALDKKLAPKQKKADKVFAAVYGQYEKYIKAETTKAVAAVEDSIGRITSKYQAMYDAVASQRSTFGGKLKEYGSLFVSDSYGYVKMKDWNAQIRQVQTLKANLQQLQKAGVSQGFLSEITSMSTSDALTYTNALIKKGTGFIREQSKGYDTLMSTASSVSSDIYKPYVDAIDKAYNQDLVTALSGLEGTLSKIGEDAARALARGLASASIKAGISKKVVNAASKTGKASQAGYAKGTRKSTKKSTKATKKAAGKNTKAAKKKLKVHSPSKVFAWIGEMTGAGYAKGLESTKRMIRNVSESAIHIPNPGAPSAAGSGSALNDNYSYGSAKYEITVISQIDGKEAARAMADPMQEELDKKSSRSSRKRGN